MGFWPSTKASPDKVPRHLAVIMDGNGRWAEKLGMPRIFGHQSSVTRVRGLIEAAVKHRISVLTLYAFSTENWSRPQQEVDALMAIYLDCLHREVPKLHEHGVRLRFLGDRRAFKPEILEAMDKAEQLMADNQGLALNVALNYGARAELLVAIQGIAQDLEAGAICASDLTEALVTDRLYTKGQVDPDLIIRTGGVQRLSNFLLWQAAYAELYFTPVHFPDFDESELLNALAWFAKQTRRFGKIDAQLEQV